MQTKQDQKTIEKYEEFWRLADKNGDGQLTIDELAAAVKKYDPSISNKDVAKMLVGIDKDGDKCISKEEYMNEVVEKPKRSEALCALFKKYDSDGNGTLSPDEVKRLIRDCFNTKQADEIYEKFMHYTDSSGDGLVSFDEFKDFFAPV